MNTIHKLFPQIWLASDMRTWLLHSGSHIILKHGKRAAARQVVMACALQGNLPARTSSTWNMTTLIAAENWSIQTLLQDALSLQLPPHLLSEGMANSC